MAYVKIAAPYPGVEIFRGEKIIYAAFKRPHQVISTCRVNGGLRSDISFVANHQACEPKPCHPEAHKKCLAITDPQAYHRFICEYHGLLPEKTVLLGTAANMTMAGFASETHPLPQEEELLVYAVVTAGVETNAGRAGDPAQVYEWEGRFHKLSEKAQTASENQGTIDIMVFVNQELAPCALVRAVKMVTEAKTAVLQELHVPSRYSEGLATGTGTDQIAIACLCTDHKPLRGAGKHVKLGELLAKAVRTALFQALALQNKRTKETIRYVPRLLERLGLGEEALLSALSAHLSPEIYDWFLRNKYALLSDTGLVAHVLSYVHLWDQVHSGVIPRDMQAEVLLDQAALIACALAQRRQDFARLFEALLPYKDDPGNLLIAALARGFCAKWENELGKTTGVVCP